MPSISSSPQEEVGQSHLSRPAIAATSLASFDFHPFSTASLRSAIAGADRGNRAAVPGLRIESNWFITLSALLLTSPMSRRRTIILNSSSISAYLWAPTSLSMSRASRGSHPYVAARLTSLPTLCACIVRPAHCLSAPNVVVARSSNVIHNLGCSLTARRTPSYVHSSSSTKCHTCPIRLPSRRPNRPCPVVLALVKSPLDRMDRMERRIASAVVSPSTPPLRSPYFLASRAKRSPRLLSPRSYSPPP